MFRFHQDRPGTAPPSHRLPPDGRLHCEANFLGRLYDALQAIRDTRGIVAEEDPDHPDTSRWWWYLHGTRERWCLEIRDHTIPELVGKPYYLDPVGDPSFFDFAWVPNSVDATDYVTDEQLNDIVTGMWTAMDEHLLGQSEALRAYQAQPDVTPWIHTDGAP